MSERVSTSNRLIGLVVAVALIVGGGYLLFAQYESMSNYEPVDATVVSAGSSTTAEGGTIPSITYEYTVDGQTYRSSNVFPGPGDSGTGSTRKVLDNYPEGTEVRAYYDPANPSDAYLVKRWHLLIPSLLIGFGALFALGTGWPIVQRFRGEDG